MRKTKGMYLILIFASFLFVNACSVGTPSGINTNSSLTETNSVASPQPESTFAGTTFTITFATEGKGTILPSPGVSTYDAGDVVTITATEVPDWVFNCWLGDVTDKLSPTTTITSNCDQTVTAYFSVIACYLDY